MSVKQARIVFAANHADRLARQVDADALRLTGTYSSRFVWYGTDDVLTLVVGAQEEGKTDLALAIGLARRGERELRLVLPHGWHEPTLYRWARLRTNLPLRVWTHDVPTSYDVLTDHDCQRVATEVTRPRPEAVPARTGHPEKPQLHLGTRTSLVADLMHWAGQQPHLDPAHRSSFRAWQYRGQRVLGITRTVGGLTITAGIDGKEGAYPRTVKLPISAPLTTAQLGEVQAGVVSGCLERDNNPVLSPDEHWLQAVLRRDPGLLGLEQPVLREVAAWRPRGSAKENGSGWGRGFVDLAGLDAAGNLLLVETKLDGDDMLVLQGLDYWIWANANRAALAQRLDCSPSVPIEVVFCVGGKTGSEPVSSRHMEAQLAALPPDLTWRVVHVTDWLAGDPPALRTVAVSGDGAADPAPSVDHGELDGDRLEAAAIARAARLGDIAEVHYAWSLEVEAEPTPDVRTEGIADAGEHYADVVATPEQNAVFIERIARMSETDPMPTERSLHNS